MPITFLEGSYEPPLPDTVERNGKTYRRREVAAYAVKDGDLTTFIDCTGKPGTMGTYAIGEVLYAEHYSSRQESRPWRRVQLHVINWRGTAQSWKLPTSDLTFAPRDRVTVYRPLSSTYNTQDGVAYI